MISTFDITTGSLGGPSWVEALPSMRLTARADAEPAMSDFGYVNETRIAELGRDARNQILLCRVWIALCHRRSPSSLDGTLSPMPPVRWIFDFNAPQPRPRSARATAAAW